MPTSPMVGSAFQHRRMQQTGSGFFHACNVVILGIGPSLPKNVILCAGVHFVIQLIALSGSLTMPSKMSATHCAQHPTGQQQHFNGSRMSQMSSPTTAMMRKNGIRRMTTKHRNKDPQQPMTVTWPASTLNAPVLSKLADVARNVRIQCNTNICVLATRLLLQ